MLPWLFVAAAALAQSLVPADFSQGIYEPEGWQFNLAAGNQVTWQMDAANPERTAVRLDGAGHDWAGITSRPVAVTPGETLTVAAWLSSRGVADGQGRLYVRFWGEGKFQGQYGPSVAPDSPQWTLLAGPVTVPDAATTADLSFQLWSTGTVTICQTGLFHGDVTAQLAGILPAPGPMELVNMKTPRGIPADANANGIPDRFEELLGIPAGAASARRTRRPTTCLQTPTPYRSDNDLKVDGILVVSESPVAFGSWQSAGYQTWHMTGFRDGQAYVDAHPGSVQQDRWGGLLDCGPGSYYMVPTADRRRILYERFQEGARGGATAAAPEEPEFIGRGGYSPAFQQEFAEHYGRPWTPPHGSVQARVDCQRLMGHLEIELLRACYDGMKSVNPQAQSFLLCHSPLNYSAWNIMFPHAEALRELKVDQTISQVWTGTARSAVPHMGSRRERTFENAWLEYSSSLNCVRGLGIPTWLLMDPVEDNPDRPMEDYFFNYKRTLGAALMFPESDLYEVMPWPTRIFGRVPDDFATVICNVIGALSDMQNHPDVTQDRGTEGIATFLADSAMWQRNEPSPSDFDAIYGLCLPMLMRGVPAQIAQLERVADPGYLDPYKILLVSFDALKPERREYVDALADWVRKGGQLILCGGQDAYNDLDLWWKQAGFPSPHAYLLDRLGLDASGLQPLGQPAAEAQFETVAKTAYTGRELGNRGPVTINLTGAIRDTGAAFVRFHDSLPADGWGPWIAGIHVRGTRGGKPVDQQVVPGTPEEALFVYRDTGSQMGGDARFVDARFELIYRFAFDPGTQAEVTFDVGNQYEIALATAPADDESSLRVLATGPLGKALRGLAPADLRGALGYAGLGGTSLLTSGGLSLLSKTQVGQGAVTVCGLNPAAFAKTPSADAAVRALVAEACHFAGLAYREQGHLGIRRGPYFVLKTLDESAPVPAGMMDLMTPDFALVPAHTQGPDELVILKQLPPAGPEPALAATSACVEWSAAAAGELKLVASGAQGVKATMRVVTGGRPLQVSSWDTKGKLQPVSVEPQGDTALLRFDAQPWGLALKIAFE
jgi:hypothetical protein